jgi:hypothetical protein
MFVPVVKHHGWSAARDGFRDPLTSAILGSAARKPVGLVKHLDRTGNDVGLGLERFAGDIGKVGQRVPAWRVQRPEQLGCLLDVEVRELPEVIVDGPDLVEGSHWSSEVEVMGKAVNEKRPSGVREEHHEAV